MEYADYLETLVMLSLNKSVDLGITDKNGNNLLMIIMIINHLFKTIQSIDVKRVFIQKLVDLGFPNSLSLRDKTIFKKDPEFLLKTFSFTTIINQIIHNYDPNYLNSNGENALMISANTCLHEVFEILIERTNIYHRDNAGKTVLDRIINCNPKEYLFMKPHQYQYSIKYTLLMLFNRQVLNTIPDLIRAENKNFLINLIHIYVNESLIDELVEIIKHIESTTGYSLNVNVKDLIANYQNTIPKVLSKNTIKYPRSGRPVTQMTRLINKSALPKLPITESKKILNNFHTDPSCFCLDINIGMYKDVYIPVLRYGKSATHGYYGTLTGQQYLDADFTWYYIEPDSDIYLHGNNVFVARNKLQAVLALDRLLIEKNLGTPDEEATYIHYKIEKLMFDSIKEYLEDLSYEVDEQDFDNEFTPMDIKDNDYFINLYKVNIFMENDEKPILGSRFTNFFRTIEEPDHPTDIYFVGGLLDYLDEPIDTLAKELGIDIVILTHQSGNSGRLVSELLDTRKRSISFANLYISN